MNAEQFVMKIQQYYGPYPKAQREVALQYLGMKSADYLKALYAVVILRFSAKWKTPPDVAVFEEVAEEAKQKTKDLKHEREQAQPQIEDRTMYVKPEEGKKLLADLLGKFRKVNTFEPEHKQTWNEMKDRMDLLREQSRKLQDGQERAG